MGRRGMRCSLKSNGAMALRLLLTWRTMPSIRLIVTIDEATSPRRNTCPRHHDTTSRMPPARVPPARMPPARMPPARMPPARIPRRNPCPSNRLGVAPCLGVRPGRHRPSESGAPHAPRGRAGLRVRLESAQYKVARDSLLALPLSPAGAPRKRAVALGRAEWAVAPASPMVVAPGASCASGLLLRCS